MSEIRAIGDRNNNAQLMADCAALGYLPEPVLDATYELGRFWKDYRPADLTTNDLDTTPVHKLVDMLHVQGYRKQPEGRRQLHARRDYSTLLVCEVGT